MVISLPTNKHFFPIELYDGFKKEFKFFEDGTKSNSISRPKENYQCPSRYATDPN